MLLKIIHQTDLTYSDLISESVVELRVVPRQEQDQHRLSFGLAVGPPSTINSYFDWLGNTVHTFSITSLHKRIQIVATSVVETDRPKTEPKEFADAWPLAEHDDYAIYDYLSFGGPVCDGPPLRELVKLLYAFDGMPLGELCVRILDLINNKFEYQQGITNAASPITEVLSMGRGVCQDFTHLMIGIARALKIPARYVSGLVHPDAEKFRGYSQTHAWCELYFPSVGWVGFDPTNHCVVGNHFVKVAVGRDYRDVSPNKGLYRGKAKESIDVQVRSEELHTIPAGLAAERFQALPIPTYPAGATLERVIAAQHQEHHQQQQAKHKAHQQAQQQQ